VENRGDEADEARQGHLSSWASFNQVRNQKVGLAKKLGCGGIAWGTNIVLSNGGNIRISPESREKWIKDTERKTKPVGKEGRGL